MKHGWEIPAIAVDRALAGALSFWRCSSSDGDKNLTVVSYFLRCRPMASAIPLTLWFDVHSTWASECPDVKNYKWRLNPVWHRMLYSCIHMATVGVKGLNILRQNVVVWDKQSRRRCRRRFTIATACRCKTWPTVVSHDWWEANSRPSNFQTLSCIYFKTR